MVKLFEIILFVVLLFNNKTSLIISVNSMPIISGFDWISGLICS